MWRVALLAAAATACSCYPAQMDTGSATAVLNWIPSPPPRGLRGELSGMLDSVTITVRRSDEILGLTSCDYEDYICTVTDIPAGSGRSLTAEAFAAEVLLYRGTASNIKITKDQTVPVPVNMTPAYAEDIYAPAAVDDLTATADGNDVSLTWTAVGDDLKAGQADSYEVRWSTSNITDANFDGANHVDANPPSLTGRPEQMPVKDLPTGATYYFALKVTDDNGNVSPLSNVAEANIQ
ncbi:MAG TPA: hypothetical protein VM425_14490 [Myxococcota bacterium]|nr:hypothetical protein [Myxococcota bacterium]